VGRSGRGGDDNILDSTGTRTPTPRSSSPQLVAIPTELSRLLRKVKLSLLQAVKAHRVVRRRGSHIF
jgi:hypothetical protein